jgi:hypothetical protein
MMLMPISSCCRLSSSCSTSALTAGSTFSASQVSRCRFRMALPVQNQHNMQYISACPVQLVLCCPASAVQDLAAPGSMQEQYSTGLCGRGSLTVMDWCPVSFCSLVL